MNIIEAREAALAGKTVIAPNRCWFVAGDFSYDDGLDWSNSMVFVEWKIKSEPVVLDVEVELPDDGLTKIFIVSEKLKQFAGKKVRVTVEVIE